MESDLAQRAELHAAVGDPVRLGIVEELLGADRSASELGDHFGLPSNLLAHHLGVLERAGLVERVVSSGDRRRRYVRLHRPVVGQLAIEGAPVTGPVLFVCTHNSARSQLAAAMWRRSTGERAASAGTHPAERVHPGAVRAAARRGLDLGDAIPRLLAPDELEHAAAVVTVCDRAHEELEGSARWLHWSIPDPTEQATTEAFDAAADLIDERISALT